MSARDDLADLLEVADANTWDKTTPVPNWCRIADAVISAGWRDTSAVRRLHYPVEIEPSDTICGECSYRLPNGTFFGEIVDYPCPTLQALETDNERA